MGGGSKTQNVVQTDMPEYAKPYFLDAMDRAQAFSETSQPQYTADRIADQNAWIGKSDSMIHNIANQGMPQTDAAMAYTRNQMNNAANIGRGFNTQFNAAGFQAGNARPYAGFNAAKVSPYAGFQANQSQDFSNLFRGSQFNQIAAPEASQFDRYGGFQAGQATEMGLADAEAGTAKGIASYMDPYNELVTKRLKDSLREEHQISAAGRNAAAVSAGAFGGSRQGVQEGLAEEKLLDRMAKVEAEQGSAAFQQARAAFEADRAANMDVNRMRLDERGRVQGTNISEQARVQGASAAENARIQEAAAQEQARVQGISIDEARRIQSSTAAENARVQEQKAAELARVQGMNVEEFARVQQQQAAELARVQGISVQEAARIQQAEAAEIARVQGISIDEAARVQTANAQERARVQQANLQKELAQRDYQMQGMQFGAQQAQQLSQLEDAARAGDIQAAQMLETIGLRKQGVQQQKMDLNYQNFIEQRDAEQRKLEQLMSIMRGVPIGSTQTTEVPYNPFQQALGAGISGLGLYRGLYG